MVVVSSEVCQGLVCTPFPAMPTCRGLACDVGPSSVALCKTFFSFIFQIDHVNGRRFASRWLLRSPPIAGVLTRFGHTHTSRQPTLLQRFFCVPCLPNVSKLQARNRCNPTDMMPTQPWTILDMHGPWCAHWFSAFPACHS